MDRIVIGGGVPLQGTITVSGAKNAALPLLAATLLTDEQVELDNVPDVADVGSMLRLLGRLGTIVPISPALGARRAAHARDPGQHGSL